MTAEELRELVDRHPQRGFRAELARRADVSESTISRIVSGGRGSWGVLLALNTAARGMGVYPFESAPATPSTEVAGGC